MATLKRLKGDKRLTILILILVVFGSFMIFSAEMGNSVGDSSYMRTVALKQAIIVILGFVGYIACKRVDIQKYSLKTYIFVYILLGVVLIACLGFGAINGAYAWIPIGSITTIQPSEFAKVFMIVAAARIFKDNDKQPLTNFYIYMIGTLLYALIIVFIQNDTGSAIVLFIICYIAALIPNSEDKKLRKIRKWMIVIIIIAIALVVIGLSPIGRFIIIKIMPDGYMKGRVLAAINPFDYQYDYGYHIIMSLVSFANGGILGQGYGNSVHKKMNFPNPSNDFILPVIVEELGFVGFIGLAFVYVFMLAIIARASIKAKNISSKIVLISTFTYITVHFVLNVGGVSGLIPLTGVPLLLISSGGSSTIACLCALGFCQREIIRNGLLKQEKNTEE